MRVLRCLAAAMVLLLGACESDQEPQDSQNRYYLQSGDGPGWGMVRYADSDVVIRAARSSDADELRWLERGESVRVDFLRDNWYAAFSLDEATRDEGRALGYVYAADLSSEPPVDDEPQPVEEPSVGYEIVELRDISHARAHRLTARVVLEVETLPSEAEMSEMAEYIWQDHRDVDEFTVWLYLPGMDPQDLAYVTAEFRRTGLVEFRVVELALWGTRWQR